MPAVILPAVLNKTIIFPGSLLSVFAPIAGMLMIWIGASLALGQCWCSWTCFYGGFIYATINWLLMLATMGHPQKKRSCSTASRKILTDMQEPKPSAKRYH